MLDSDDERLCQPMLIYSGAAKSQYLTKLCTLW